MKSSNNFGVTRRPKPSIWKRILLIALPLVFALLVGGIFLTRYLGEEKVKELVELAESRSVVLQRQDIQLFALPLAWSVRKELMRANYDGIDDYFNELIQRKGFGVIMLLDPAGTIKVSTDRKLQGNSFLRRYPQMKLGALVQVSYALPEGKSMFLVPVMGLNSRLGTIAFIYSYRTLSLP